VVLVEGYHKHPSTTLLAEEGRIYQESIYFQSLCVWWDLGDGSASSISQCSILMYQSKRKMHAISYLPEA